MSLPICWAVERNNNTILKSEDAMMLWKNLNVGGKVGEMLLGKEWGRWGNRERGIEKGVWGRGPLLFAFSVEISQEEGNGLWCGLVDKRAPTARWPKMISK